MSTKPVYMMDFVERAKEIMRLKMELAEAHEGIMRLNDWQNGTGIPAVDAVARVRELCVEWDALPEHVRRDCDVSGQFLRALDGTK